MRASVIVLVVVAGLGLVGVEAVDGQARRAEISPIVGYMWGGGGEVYQGNNRGDLQFDGAMAYGAVVDFAAVRPGAFVEAAFMVQPTSMTLTPFSVGDVASADLTNYYFHIGGLFEALNSGPLKPFGAITLGATMMDPDVQGAGAEWFFSFSFGGGVKAYVSERVAVRVQARGWVSTLYGGSGFYFGTGGVGVSTWVGDTSTQGEVSAGLSFVL